jgi:hypothetical protein
MGRPAWRFDILQLEVKDDAALNLIRTRMSKSSALRYEDQDRIGSSYFGLQGLQANMHEVYQYRCFGCAPAAKGCSHDSPENTPPLTN